MHLDPTVVRKEIGHKTNSLAYESGSATTILTLWQGLFFSCSHAHNLLVFNLASTSSTFTNSEFSKCDTPCFRPEKHRNLNLILAARWLTYCPRSLPGTCSYVFINEVVFRNIPRIQWTRHYQFSPHGSTEYHFHHIHEVLLFLEAANELGVVWSSGDGQKPTD